MQFQCSFSADELVPLIVPGDVIGNVPLTALKLHWNRTGVVLVAPSAVFNALYLYEEECCTSAAPVRATYTWSLDPALRDRFQLE